MMPNARMGGIAMIDRAHVDDVIYRVAVSSFLYYPTKSIDEPGYTIDEDLDWCLALLPVARREEFRDRIRTLISDPDADRRSFVRDIRRLSGH